MEQHPCSCLSAIYTCNCYISHRIQMSYKAPFQVVVRDKAFNLSRDQFTFEPGNLFETTYLLKSPGGVSGSNNILKVDRHPGSFHLIVDYLSGYDIFPVSDEECFKAGLDRERLLRYLVSDAICYSLPNLGDRTKKEIIRLRAEEIKSGKVKTDTALEIAKMHSEVERLRIESERASVKDKLDHEIKLLELQHEHTKYFKRLAILMERGRAIKDIEITTSVLSPAASPLFAPSSPNQGQLFNNIQAGIEEMLQMSPGSLGRAKG